MGFLDDLLAQLSALFSSAPVAAPGAGAASVITLSPNVPSEYRDDLLQAALQRPASGIPTSEWAAVIGGIVSRETAYASSPHSWGQALRPRGPSGAGDPAKRWKINPPDWAVLTGQTRIGTSGVQQEYGPPQVPGFDGRGFGMGLGQVDLETSGESWEYFVGGEWAKPLEAFKRVAETIAAQLDTFGDLRDAVAAYNHGASSVQARLNSGRAVDWPDQAGGDYATDALQRAALYGLDPSRISSPSGTS